MVLYPLPQTKKKTSFEIITPLLAPGTEKTFFSCTVPPPTRTATHTVSNPRGLLTTRWRSQYASTHL
jgi:hypothetical protein